MIDPLTSLAFTLYSNRGVHALLLGSGVSRAAEIPTGWEVVMDLIRKVAALDGQSCGADPAEWWRSRSGKDPSYSELLDALAKAPAERQQILRRYFEPSAEERATGAKTPTAAHRAIAQLVLGGFTRVMITTNFDRLMERALEELGLTPTIISTADQITGALPLAHSGATVIKVNGDYLDTRIRNTEAELARYDKGLNRLLDQIFDEYGLVICGWSAEWDPALASAITRCRSRRFTTFWASRSTPSGQAQRLINDRGAEHIPIKDADSFFQSLQEKVQGLADAAAPHPLSAKLAVATEKRYLADPSAVIRLHDLLVEETERVYATCTEANFPYQTSLSTAEELRARLAKYEAAAETLLALMITGCYWGTESHSQLWVNSLERIANPTDVGSGTEWLLKLRLYPALLLLYGGGVAAVAAEKYSTLSALFTKPIRRKLGNESPLLLSLHQTAVMETTLGQLLPGLDRHYTPASDYMIMKLRTQMREYLSQDAQYQIAFDRFEYLLALVYLDLNLNTTGSDRAPVGCFAWRGRHMLGRAQVLEQFGNEIVAAGDKWSPLRAGLFGGEIARALELKERLYHMIEGFSWN